mmetsp:Transcript_7640/g.8331  ORF Transcript_7640/g.8331 Transcript_7640/m.8331 type:complete len:83 (+) Transcript_7640:3228-3476(+)
MERFDHKPESFKVSWVHSMDCFENKVLEVLLYFLPHASFNTFPPQVMKHLSVSDTNVFAPSYYLGFDNPIHLFQEKTFVCQC